MLSGDRLALSLDLDGTMVDTDRLHLAAWNAVLARSGRRVDAAFYKSRIMGFDAAAVTAAQSLDRPTEERAALAAEKAAAFRSLVGWLEPTPGLPRLLAWAEAEGLPVAV